MIIDILKNLVPNGYLPWILLLCLVAWIGWKTNDVASLVNQHYTETNQMYKAIEQTCKAVSKLATLDAKECYE